MALHLPHDQQRQPENCTACTGENECRYADRGEVRFVLGFVHDVSPAVAFFSLPWNYRFA